MGGNNKQQYCLRWNQHRTNMLSVFDQLLQAEALTDVTLSCQGASIKCHRIVLAASSAYFQHLFLDGLSPAYAVGSQGVHHPQQHPIVVFKDIQLAELRAILEFIYRGEVSVAQEQVGVLLKAAESLKVKGLYSEDASSPAGLSGLSFEPTAAGQNSNSAPFLVQHQLPTTNGGSTPSSSGPVQQQQQRPLCFKRSPIISPEDKDRDGSSSSEATPPEDERDEDHQLHRGHLHHGVLDRVKSSRSPVFIDPLKDMAPNASLSPFVVNGVGVSGGKNNVGVVGSNGQTRPELKRYRQYTRHDIQAAIEAVRSGQSALQASRLYGVPSRTLYDKVKKLGIATGRPYRQSQAIAVAVSLAQAQQASQQQQQHQQQQQTSNGSTGRLSVGGTGGGRGGSSSPVSRDDEDSMDMGVHHHHHHALSLHHHFRRRPNTLEELSMYFAASPAAAAAAAAAAAELALQQQQQRAAVSDEDDEEDSGTHPSAAVVPMDLSQSYERMLQRVGEAGDVNGRAEEGNKPNAATAELVSTEN